MAPIGAPSQRLPSAPSLLPREQVAQPADLSRPELHEGEVHVKEEAKKITKVFEGYVTTGKYTGEVRSLGEVQLGDPEAASMQRPSILMQFGSVNLSGSAQFIVGAPRVPTAASLLSPEAIAKEVAVQLRQIYLAKQTITLLVSQKQIEINTLYTRLAIIGEAEKEKKKKETEEAKTLGQEVYGSTPTYEAILEPKEIIELEWLFNRKEVKDASQKRILIQGSAGIGKSTLCHHIAYRWAQGTLFPQFEYVFWISLRNLNEENYPSNGSPSLEKCLVRECFAKEYSVESSFIIPFLQSEELKKKTLILLDGYDELPSKAGTRGTYLNLILEELKNFPNVLITTRPQLVDTFTPTCRLEILGFDVKGIEEYVDKFFVKEQSQAQEFRKHLQNPLIRSLARIPINLEIFCTLVANHEPLFSSGILTITGLYANLTGWLYRRFRLEYNPVADVIEDTRPSQAEDVKPFEAVLKKVAWKAMEDNKLYLPLAVIQGFMPSGMSIGSIRRIGPLRIENGEGVFIHLTFQEYFAALYLANLYESNPIEASERLAEIKFKPRYQLVLPMVAGCFSLCSNRAALQAFFKDLFSEPRDLGISYERRLQARCFEECSDPSIIPQYEKFISDVVKYLKKHPIEQRKIEVLTGNTRLFNQEDVAQVFVQDLQNESKKESLIKVLRELAMRGLLFQDSILAKISTIFNDVVIETPDMTMSTAKSDILQIVSSLAKNGHPLPKEIIARLISILKAREKGDVYVVSTLETVAQSGHPMIKEVLPDLIDILKDSKAHSGAADILVKMVEGDHSLLQRIVSDLVSILRNPKMDFFGKSATADALGKIANKGYSLSNNARFELVLILSDAKVNPLIRCSIASGLLKVSKSDHSISLNVLFTLLTSEKNYWFVKRAADALEEMIYNNHPLSKVVLLFLKKIAIVQEMDFDVYRETARVLVNVAKSRHPLSNEARRVLDRISKTSSMIRFCIAWAWWEALKSELRPIESFLPLAIDVLKDSHASSKAKSLAAHALKELAKSGCLISKETIDTLTVVLSDPKTTSEAKSSAANALWQIANSCTQFPEETLHALSGVLRDQKMDKNAKHRAAGALGKIAKSSTFMPPGVLDTLSDVLKDPQIDSSIQSSVAETLELIARGGHPISDEILLQLITILQDPQKTDSNVKFHIAGTLEQIVKNNSRHSEDALTALIMALKVHGNPCVKRSVERLGSIAASAHSSHERVLSVLLDILTDPKADAEAKDSTARVLGRVLIKHHSSHEIVLPILFNILKESTGYVQSSAASALETLTKSGYPLSEEAIGVLAKVLIDPKADEFAKSYAADALGKTAQLHPHLNALPFLILDEQHLDIRAKCCAAFALKKLAEDAFLLPEAALPALRMVLADPMTGDWGKSSAKSAIEKMATSSLFSFREALNAAKLCFLTGHAFFCRDDKFYVSNQLESKPLELELLKMDDKTTIEELSS